MGNISWTNDHVWQMKIYGWELNIKSIFDIMRYFTLSKTATALFIYENFPLLDPVGRHHAVLPTKRLSLNQKSTTISE